MATISVTSPYASLKETCQIRLSSSTHIVPVQQSAWPLPQRHSVPPRIRLPWHGHCLKQRKALSGCSATSGKVQGCRASATIADHDSFLRSIARAEPPSHLSALLRVLQAQGQQLTSPEIREGVVPLAVPLASDPLTGQLTALLRWPTPPEGLEMPVVSVLSNGSLRLIARSADEYITRSVIEDEAGRKLRGNGNEGLDTLAASLSGLVDGADLSKDERCEGWRGRGGEGGSVRVAAGEECTELLASSGLTSAMETASALDAFVTKHVGMFPDVLERLALRHLAKGDEVSALVTGEYYSSRNHFPGFGSPFFFNALLLLRVNRATEARDAARIALRSPWWTLSATYQSVASVAGYGEAQLEFARERLSEQGRADDLTKGKAPAQVSLDQAAFLLDVAAAEAKWDADLRRQVAVLYEEAGVDDVAAFLRAGL